MALSGPRAIASLLALSAAVAACAPLRSHQGYVIDADLVNSVQPGVDNRESVLRTLGQPTLTAQFNQGEWYYVSRDSRNLAFNNPDAKAQTTIRIRFDPNGTVRSIDRMGLEQIASVSPTSKKTPTLGREKSFFQELFGNIGTVGAAGTGGGGGGPR
ncbi:outer membrane protein assembly factor BamE [Sphingomonas sp. Y38-1Y]|uniref:outer membrane protein assembly factor BamE n=1 Tax=Sphingomonas sp. Y38-1Y TaxID=3078265 RepID=UPI0028E9B3F1|nr:outer membrane protein assembly factor BamE [Sphingomonas sp. Y38-1Y]